MPNLIPPILNPMAPAGCNVRILLSLGRKFVSLTSDEACTEPWPYMLQDGFTLNYSEYTLEERAKM